MSDKKLTPETRLVELTIKDKNKWYGDDAKGKEYEVSADMVLAGQAVELKSVPIPPELSVQIIALIERAAVLQITDAMQKAQAVLQTRLSADPAKHLIGSSVTDAEVAHA